ncbi:BgTH12-05272 [Blumeria graminis f. sp. triticale]|uniref:BgTH12-05272 n=1 Tax=Blumeria graminis f. sp. triticale TaxID=1689686 RepID=A0A9W4D681_BLUGR|nr:BgTH12-05272 [Blumeria graminis f. sp. triticale]
MDIIAAHIMPRQEEHEEHKELKSEEAAEPPITINQTLNSLKCLLSFKELILLMRMERSL